MMGHDPRFPVQDEWDDLTAELEFYIQQNSSEPVVLLGHSLGAIVSFKLALRSPELVKGLIMLDPPLIYGVTTFAIRTAKWFGAIDQVTPAHRSKHRRRVWSSLYAAESYIRSKPFFSNLHQEVIVAWLEHGLLKNREDYRLAFDVQKEVEIFRTTPLHLDKLKGRLTVPGWLIYATDSNACWSGCVHPFARKFGLTVQTTVGGHMFPLTRLDETASLINHCLRQLQAINGIKQQ